MVKLSPVLKFALQRAVSGAMAFAILGLILNLKSGIATIGLEMLKDIAIGFVLFLGYGFISPARPRPQNDETPARTNRTGATIEGT